MPEAASPLKKDDDVRSPLVKGSDAQSLGNPADNRPGSRPALRGRYRRVSPLGPVGRGRACRGHIGPTGRRAGDEWAPTMTMPWPKDFTPRNCGSTAGFGEVVL
jgi:hypothetical protein